MKKRIDLAYFRPCINSVKIVKHESNARGRNCWYAHVQDPNYIETYPRSIYVSHSGQWSTDCINGWFSSKEALLEAVVKCTRPPWTMKRKDVTADDINTLLLKMTDAVTDLVDDLSIAEQDDLWGKLGDVLEKFFNYPDYRSHN